MGSRGETPTIMTMRMMAQILHRSDKAGVKIESHRCSDRVRWTWTEYQTLMKITGLRNANIDDAHNTIFKGKNNLN